MIDTSSVLGFSLAELLTPGAANIIAKHSVQPGAGKQRTRETEVLTPLKTSFSDIACSIPVISTGKGRKQVIHRDVKRSRGDRRHLDSM